MADTKTPQEITTAIEQAFSDREAFKTALLHLLERHGYYELSRDASTQAVTNRALRAADDMVDVTKLLTAHGYDVARNRLSVAVAELLARPAASTLRPAVSSGERSVRTLVEGVADQRDELAGSLFTLLSHLGYEPEGEATPDELARLVDVAMEETASYTRLESEVRALTAALDAGGARGWTANGPRKAGSSPLDSFATAGDDAEPERLTREYDITITRQSDGLPGVQIGSYPVGAAIHDEERIRQMMREEMDARFQPLTGIPLFEARSEWDAEIRKIVRDELGNQVRDAVDTAKRRKPN